jgi:integrase
VNLDVIALGNLFKRAVREGLVEKSPTTGFEPLRHRAPVRPLWSLDQIESLVSEAAKGRRGQLVVDYLRLLAYSGARRQEAIELCWSDVDFERRTVRFHRAVKYGKARTLDMNPRLEAHLRDMNTRRGSERFLFPGNTPGQPAHTLVKSIARARKAAGLPDLRPHDLRHAFLSRGVMAGVDWITLAQWAGHSDGGVLIGKVYGHLSDEHRKRMAEKV